MQPGFFATKVYSREVRTQGQLKSSTIEADRDSVSCSRTLQQGGRFTEIQTLREFKGGVFAQHNTLLLSKSWNRKVAF